MAGLVVERFRFFVALAPGPGFVTLRQYLFIAAKLWGMGCKSSHSGYLDALDRNRGCASAYLRSRALTLAMAASISPARLAWASLPDFTAS